MARNSSRRGPAANFELTAPFVTIPGLTITRFFDDGPLNISYAFTVQNATAGTITAQGRVLLDTAAAGGSGAIASIAAAQFDSLAAAFTVGLTQGPHTIELQAAGGAAAGDVALFDKATLSVNQLPTSDDEADVLA